MFSFFLVELQCTILYPKGMLPPVWIFKSGCTPYVASTHVHNWIRMYAPIILLSYIVCFRYCNTHLNFALSSLVLFFTIVHRNDMAVSMSGLPPFATHNNFATMEFRMSESFYSSLLELLSMFCLPFFAGCDTFALSCSPNKSIDS